MPDIVTGKTFVDGEKGITATKLNQIISQAVIQPSFVSGKPASSTLDPTDQLLELKGAGTYATITGQQLIDSVSASVTQNIQPTIWSVRLRSFNAIGNPTFEVDQRSCGTLVTNANALVQDRWVDNKGGTLTYTAQQVSAGNSVGGGVLLPGTNFVISNAFHRFTLTGQQASLGATDHLGMYSILEGTRFRELMGDVHSLSILVRSSVANLKFGCALQDPGTTRSLTKLCTLGTANAWILIPLPNLPVWPSAGNFSSAVGIAGYLIQIVLAAGSTATAPANDAWQNGNFYGAIGQSNFAASPVNSTFDIACVQHEPGNQCSTPIDCPFSQNLDEALRYYQKSYPYATAIGTVGNPGQKTLIATGAMTSAFGPVIFPKIMAKTPTVVLYNGNTGAASSVRDNNGTDHVNASASNPSDSGFTNISFSTATAGALPVYLQYTADSGW
jgi:hypothetical protein